MSGVDSKVRIELQMKMFKFDDFKRKHRGRLNGT